MSSIISNYLFRVKFLHQKKVYRDIEMYGDWSLEELSELILKSVKFSPDHCCGFYSNIKNMYDSEEIYETFADIDLDDEEEDEEDDFIDSKSKSKSMKNTLIKDVFEIKKKMLFYFDYGDNWKFVIECKDIVDKDFTKSGIIKTEGKAPLQYPRTKRGQEEWELFH